MRESKDFPPAVAPSGALLGRLVYRAHVKRRAIVEVNLAWCFPQLDARARRDIARRYFVHLAQSLLDYGLLWWASGRTLERADQSLAFCS